MSLVNSIQNSKTRRQRAERGVYAADGHGWKSASEPSVAGPRFCGLKAALLARVVPKLVK